MPEGYVTLRAALAGFPGEKPWGRAVRAMLSDEIDFHVVGKQSIRRIMVDPAKVARLKAAPIGPGPLGVTRVTVRDACEILRAGYEEVSRAIREKGLEVSRHERERGFERASFAEFVGEVAFTGEAAAYKRRNAMSLHNDFIRIGVPRLHTAWCREALVDLGMVMPLPAVPKRGRQLACNERLVDVRFCVTIFPRCMRPLVRSRLRHECSDKVRVPRRHREGSGELPAAASWEQVP